MDTLIRWSWVFGLVGVTALLGALATWFVLDTLDGAPTWFLVGGGVSLLLYAVLDRERMQETVQSRSFVYGSGSALTVVLVAAIGVAGYLLAKERDRTWDLTTSGEFTLSDHSVRIAEGLSQPVRILAFFRHESPEQREFRDLVRRFEERSPNLTVEYVDPLRNPRQAEQYEVTSDHGVVVIESGDNVRRIETRPTEEKLTNALVLVTSDEEHRICWSTGHGEPDPDDEFSERGMGVIVTELEGLNYQITKSTITTSGIERECEALVIARPQTDFLPAEREALAVYLAEGGRAVVLLEPGLAPELAAELERYGVRVGDDIVLDYNPQNRMLGVDDPSFVVLTGDNIERHPITRNLSAAIVLGISRSIGALEGAPEGLRVEELLRTSADAWGETSSDALEVSPDEGTELVGFVPVAAAVEIVDPAVLEVAPRSEGAVAPAAPAEGGAPPSVDLDRGRGVPADFTPQAGGRLVVYGDSDFPNNVFLAWGNNRDLFLNTIAWLVDEEEQIGERPDEGDMLEMTAVGEAMLCLVSIFLVPGAAVFFAGMTLLRRRYL